MLTTEAARLLSDLGITFTKKIILWIVLGFDNCIIWGYFIYQSILTSETKKSVDSYCVLYNCVKELCEKWLSVFYAGPVHSTWHLRTLQ